MKRLIFSAVLAMCGWSSQACSGAADEPLVSAAGRGEATMQKPKASGAPVAGLPFAQGKSFATLDEYLAHLQARGAYDVPWYRETSPGVYVRVTGRGKGAGAARTYTRGELAREFGFPESEAQ